MNKILMWTLVCVSAHGVSLCVCTWFAHPQNSTMKIKLVIESDAQTHFLCAPRVIFNANQNWYTLLTCGCSCMFAITFSFIRSSVFFSFVDFVCSVFDAILFHVQPFVLYVVITITTKTTTMRLFWLRIHLQFMIKHTQQYDKTTHWDFGFTIQCLQNSQYEFQWILSFFVSFFHFLHRHFVYLYTYAIEYYVVDFRYYQLSLFSWRLNYLSAQCKSKKTWKEDKY